MTTAATSNMPWPTVKLGDVCEVKAGQSPDGANYTSDSSFVEFHQGCKAFGERFLQSSDVYTKEVTKLADAGSIVMSVRAPVGTVNITQREICIGRGLCTFVPAQLLLRDYLYNYLLASNDKLNNVASAGSVFPSISRKQLMSFPLPLPPLEVQREIVAKVEKGLAEADGLAAHFKRLVALADETFKAELDETFQSLSAPTVKLGDVCEFRRGLTYKKTDEVLDSSIRVLRSNNVDLDSGELDLADIKCLRNDLKVAKEKFVFKDTILMCMANGSKAHLGKVAFIEKDEEFAFGGFMGLLIPNKVYSKYVYFSLRTPSFKDFIKSLQDGANINNLKFSDISDYPIPLPSLEEQQVIVAKLESVKAKCERLKVEAERGVKAAEALRKAVLAEAFEQ